MDSEDEGIAAEDNLHEVSLMEFTVFVNDEEWDVVPAGITPEARRDFLYGAIRFGLDSPEVVVVESLTARSGNVRRLHSLDGSEHDLVVLDGVAGKRAGRVRTRGDMFRWCLWIGEGVVLAVDGSGVRGLLILRGRDEERLKIVVGDGLCPVVMRRGSVLSIPSHLSQRHFSRYVSV